MGRSAKTTKTGTTSTGKSTTSTGRSTSPGAINKSKPTSKSKSSQSAGASKKSTSTDWGKSLSNISNSKPTSGNKAGSRPKTSTSSNITKKDTADLGLSTLPSLSLSDTDKFNTWANEYGGSNLIMSPNQKNVKDGYIRVIQPNGTTSLVSRKSLESAVSREAKKNAWQTKEQMGLDKFTEDKTPTAYTDIYGYSHVADASTAAQYQNYAERMKQALGNTYTFSGKGNTQETSGIGTSNLYDYTGNQSGGYARNEKGERTNLPLPGAVNFGNKVDSQGRVIQEPWADASTIGASKNYQDVISQLRSKTQAQPQQIGTQALTGEALIAKIKQGDSTLGESEIQRAQQVYQQAQASGDTERANLAHKWANRVREAMGVSSQYDPVTGAVSANEGDTNIPEGTYTGDTGEYDFSDIDNAVYRDWETDRKSTRLNSSHRSLSRMPSSA